MGLRLGTAICVPHPCQLCGMAVATCPDMVAPSYTLFSTQEPRKVAANEEERKIENYRDLPPGHMFSPIAIGTLGVIGPMSLTLLRELGRHIAVETGEPKSTEYLLQRLSVATCRSTMTSWPTAHTIYNSVQPLMV